MFKWSFAIHLRLWMRFTLIRISKVTQTSEVQAHSDRIVVVIGASSGIGAAISRGLCSAGNKVFACSRDLDRLKKAFTDCDVIYSACDATNEGAVARSSLSSSRSDQNVSMFL